MSTGKLVLPYAEFYITNVCNFNCTGCNRFNNYAFAGTQRWKDYADTYQNWSNLLDLKKFTILGGEPMLNPTYLDWLNNIIRLWPTATGSFLTNGYYFKSDNQELYNILKNTNGRVFFEIGLHNINRMDDIMQTVTEWLHGKLIIKSFPKNIKELPNFDSNWVSSYNAIRSNDWPDCSTVDEWESLPEFIKHECATIHKFSPEQLAKDRLGYIITDSNNVQVRIAPENFFHQGALVRNQQNSFSLHNSDPIKAHAICHSKTCHHFDKGLLYKCGQVALFKEIDQQFHLEITDQDRKLIHDYQPGTITSSQEHLAQFISELDQPLSQCKFCPEYYDINLITAESGNKIKMKRKLPLEGNS